MPIPVQPAIAPASPVPDLSIADLSIVIVSWNVWPILQACLASLEQTTRSDPALPPTLRRFGLPRDDQTPHTTLEVIVVDNGSADETCAQLPPAFPWVRFIATGENLGFTGGNNLGYAHAQGKFIYFLNPDTEVIPGPGGEDSLGTLYAAVAADPTIALAGPRLFYGNGALQYSRRRFPTRWTGFFESTWLGRKWTNNPWIRDYFMVDWPADFAHDVDWVVGAAMLARRDALEAIRLPHLTGPFDEAFFMYSEEVDLCHRLRDKGGRVVYVPTAQVRHHEGRSSQQVIAAQLIRFNRSKITYARKYFGRGWSEFLRRYLLLEFRLMRWEEWLKWRLGSKRALRAKRIAYYQQVLQDGLHPQPLSESPE
ncbi:MAG: glycosyltransferase family 2 protein [Litorilinea sp.]